MQQSCTKRCPENFMERDHGVDGRTILKLILFVREMGYED